MFGLWPLVKQECLSHSLRTGIPMTVRMGNGPPVNISILFIVLTGFLLFDCKQADAQESQHAVESENEIAASNLIYVSDYFSFVGKDEQGHVAFALDNNRGRDDETWQAEHFVVLHDERKGWIKVTGNGAYENRKKELLSIPDSSIFQFQGSAQSGIIITSLPNNLTLFIEPIPERLSRTHNGAHYRMGSAPAKLEWAERTLNGRVIYEYLLIPDFNRLTRSYWRLWNEYQGFYLSIEGRGDVYLHSQQSEMIAPLVGEKVGFLVLGEATERFEEVELNTVTRTLALGFYRWPTKWDIRWMETNGFGTIQIELSQFNRIANWVIGGFAMGIVQGEVNYEGQAHLVYGLAELIM